MNKYLVTISETKTDEFVTYAYGTLPVMNFAAKAGLTEIKDKSGDFSAKIVEVEAIGTEDEKRTVVSVTGDAETVTVVVKKKLARERKENSPVTEETETETPAATDAE